MSWHYLQGREAESWEGSSLDGAPSALLKLIPTPERSCSQGKPTDASNRSPFGMTLRRSTGTDGAEELTWFQGDSPVRTYLPLEREQDSTAHDLDCGPRWPGSLARCNPPMFGWKTRQCSLFGGLTEFSGTWPRWGTMRDGELWAVPTLEPIADERDCGFWPAPTKSWGDGREGGSGAERNFLSRVGKPAAVFHAHMRKHLCPTFGERLMRFPTGWTDCTASGMHSNLMLWLRHGKRSPVGEQNAEIRGMCPKENDHE